MQSLIWINLAKVAYSKILEDFFFKVAIMKAFFGVVNSYLSLRHGHLHKYNLTSLKITA